MKRIAYLLGLFFFHFSLFTSPLQAQKIEVDNYEQLRIAFSVDMPTVGEVTLGGQTFTTLSLDGCMPSEGVGTPALPVWSHLIETPLNSGIDVEVTDAVYDTLQLKGAPLMPLQPSRSKSDTSRHPLAYNKEVYSWDVFVGEPTKVEDVGIARDRRLARLQFSPVQYNPVRNQIVVCRQATVTVRYRNADKSATMEMFNLHHSPAFASGAQTINSLYPKAVRTTTPVRYLIVANSMFRGQMDTFVQWKQRKGFRVDIVYTDNPSVGTTTTSIAAYIKNLYTNATLADPAPTYVLLVGDVAQLPAFSGTTDNSHVTDLYFMSWTTGDDIPDCHYGRFSAQNISQLTPQIEKTLMYEQYTFADPSFLDHAVMVAGVDRGSNGDHGYTHADPAMDYAVTNYFNGAHGWSDVRYFKNNTSIIPSGITNVTVASSASNMAATVRSYYNQGAGFINYSAHGSSTSWGTPNFTTTHVADMTNTQKFGLMIGNCCLTNKFEESTCFGESLLRKGNYCGAVGYIGGSNSTYWDEDLYWAVGLRSSIGASMSMAYDSSNLGVYDRSFHTHGESYADWCTTQGSIIMQGNMAVQSSTSSLKLYYWEIYHLMGDPSVMPYLTQPSVMTLGHSDTVTTGIQTLAVTAVPHAYVALVDTATHTLLAAAYADDAGSATLTLPADLTVGTYLLTASAQQYRTAFSPLTVVFPSGPYPFVTSITPQTFTAGDSVALTIRLSNPGNTTAYNIDISFSSSTPLLTLSTTTLHLDSLAAGAEATLTGITAYASADSPDDTPISLGTATTWNGATNAANAFHRLTIFAPVVTIAFSNTHLGLLPSSTATVSATLRNIGHVATPIGNLMATAPTILLGATVAGSPFTLQPGGQATVPLTIHVDSQLPQHITIPLSCRYGRFCDTLPVFIGAEYIETFEDSTTHVAGWQSTDSYPWTATASHAYEGAYSLRSSAEATHNTTSDATLAVTVATADSVSFHYRVSSETGFDKFHFLIDGTPVLQASGEVDWTRASYPLDAGSHTLTFRYAKDHSEDRGNDCAWIDYVVLPHEAHSVSFIRHDTCLQASPSAQTSMAANGDVTILDIRPHPSYQIVDEIVACDSYQHHGSTFTASTFLTDSLLSAFGCDSIVSIALTVNHSSIGDTLHASTQATSYEWYGTVYNTSGTYRQVFTNSQGCDSTIVLVLSINGTQGIGETTEQQLTTSCYPNPTTGWIHLGTTVDDITVFDPLGRIVIHSRQADAVDLGSLAPGIYTLRLSSRGATATLRVVKQ